MDRSFEVSFPLHSGSGRVKHVCHFSGAKAYVSQSCTATLSVSVHFDQYDAVRLGRVRM